MWRNFIFRNKLDLSFTILIIQSQDFMRILAIFQPLHRRRTNNKLNTKKNKLLFSFRMYDLDGDGEISKVSFISYWGDKYDNHSVC